MRKLILLVACIYVCCSINARAPGVFVKFRVKNSRSGIVTLELPVNKNYFVGNKRELIISNEGTCSINLSESETGFIKMNYEGKNGRIFLQKGDRLIIDADTSVRPVFSFEGNNAAGQALFSSTGQPTYSSDILSLVRNDSAITILDAHLADEKAKKIQAFKELYEAKKIDSTFMASMLMQLEYLYTGAAAVLMLDRISSEKNYYKQSPDAHIAYWESLFTKLPLDKKNGGQVPGYILLVNNYLDGYLPFKRKRSGDSTTNKAKLKQLMISTIRKEFPISREYLEAWELYLAYSQDDGQTYLTGMVNNFTGLYPQSRYKKILNQSENKVIESRKPHPARDLNKDEILVKDYHLINSLTELKEKFKGKMFFVDIWATWCSPCKEQFAYKEGLENYLKEKNIVMVYLSLDKKENEKAWRRMITYYNLSGFHIMANEAFHVNVQNELREGVFSIPRYLLVDEKGEIVERNALEPSEKERLYKQIGSHLK